MIATAWLVAILGFGFFWNNSDDQFYFQMAPAFGVLAARIPARRGRAAVAFLALSLVGSSGTLPTSPVIASCIHGKSGWRCSRRRCEVPVSWWFRDSMSLRDCWDCRGRRSPSLRSR